MPKPKRPLRLNNHTPNNENNNNNSDSDAAGADATTTTTTTMNSRRKNAGTTSISNNNNNNRAPSRRIRLMIIVLGVLLVTVALLLLRDESKVLLRLTTTTTTNHGSSTIGAFSITTTTTVLKQQPRKRRLGDDCLLIYLDVGSNIGVHNRFLMEPQHYPQASQVITGVFDRAFGSHTVRDNRDICAFGFEPNPIHKQRQQQLQQAYQRMGWRYHYIGAGVGDHDGNMTFYHKTNDKEKEEWGFSMVQESPNEISEMNVPIVHLTEWIRHHIMERTLPTTIYGKYIKSTQQHGKVVMKLDIEGEEFHVLPNLITSGIFCSTLDIVFGEYHPDTAHLFNRIAPRPPPFSPPAGVGENNNNNNDDDKQGELQIGDGRDAIRWFNGMIRVLTSVDPKDCRGRWINLDDEHYLHDGIPFPKPPPPSS